MNYSSEAHQREQDRIRNESPNIILERGLSSITTELNGISDNLFFIYELMKEIQKENKEKS